MSLLGKFEAQSAAPSGVSAAICGVLARRGTDHALAFQGRWYTWKWLDRSREQLDDIFRRGRLAESASCALVVRNRPPHVAAMAAQLASGRPLQMVHSMQSATGIAADVENLRPAVVLSADDDLSPEVLSAASNCGAMVVRLSDDDAGAFALLEQSCTGRDTARTTVDRSVAVELLSSGTTGKPKRVALSWSAVESMVSDAHGAYAGTETRTAPLLIVHPLGNIAGISYLAPALAYGQRIVLLEKFEASEWADAVRTYRPVRSSIPPVALRLILEVGVPRSSLSSLEVVAVGGGKLAPVLQDEFEQTYGIPVLTAYGATEFGGVIANWTLPLYREFGRLKRGSVGRASGGVALRVAYPENIELAPVGNVGLLEVLVPRIGSEWMRTSDWASLDQDGFLYLHGRADAAINRGGFKIVPERVAEVLRSHPAVEDAAVVGLANARLGEVPVAAVEVKHDSVPPTEGELLQFVRNRVMKYEIPESILILPRLPRNGAMKVSEPDIRKLFDNYVCK